MNEHSGHALEMLRKDDEFALYRGGQPGYPFPVLMLIAVAQQPAPQSLKRLQHEYSLAAELEPAWAAQPLALTRREARTMLVLTDAGGEPLGRFIGRPMELRQFLRIAIGLSAALGRIHQRGLVHKDIKPANVLVDVASGKVWFTGFGIASRLPHESQAPAPPEVIAGTLAYMAPEQTGRMNRSIDARSDLYSLGVTLYEMLTGTLPFVAADPLEWVHCHIARQPTPPGERATVPDPLSTLVMKLLAKNAEERYQTAAGLESDLRRCLVQWEAQSRIDAFPLGTHDVSDRFRIAEKLYGREREIEALLAAFARVAAEGTPELVLVSGYSGVGKSSVVNELHKVLVPPRGLFASGKFDQYKRDIPYATLAQAFQTLVRQILAKSEAEVARWRHALAEAVGPNGQLIVGLIPEFEFIVGKQPPVPELLARDAQNRFQMVFLRFIGAFARPEHPLALFLDDLQWLDPATLDLLEHVVTHSELRHLLLVGAYRDNEVGPAHPLVRTVAAIRKADARVQEIVLAPLGLDDVGRLAADALHCGRDRASPLARLVHEKTGGNPFFTIQFFTALAEQGLLAFDPVAPAWQWDIDRIRAKNYTDNVVDLMAGKLKRLSSTSQEVLKQLACLGNVAPAATLSLVHGTTEAETETVLQEAVHAGLVFHQESTWRFLHDRIQQAAYSLIPDEQRADVHLRIGRLLLANLAADQLAEQLFDVASQFNRGAERLIERDEKARVAAIELRAGRKAKASAAYSSANVYLAAGIALLDETCWATLYELMFSLRLECAACKFLTGEFDTAEQLLVELLQRAAAKVDRAAVYHQKILLHTVKSESAQAVDTALACLRLFGIDLATHPTPQQAQAEYERLRQILDDRPIESLIDLPLMTDPELQAAMQVLSTLLAPAYFTDSNLFSLLVCRMVNLSMQHGMCGASTHGCGYLGIILGPVFHRYGDGYRFGQLACDLVDKHGFVVYRAKVLYAMGTTGFWTQPMATPIDFVRASFRAAIETGDLPAACYDMYHLCTLLLLRNDPLDAVWRESELALDFARQAKYGAAVDIIRNQQRFVATMQGRTANLSTFSDSQFDEAAFEVQLAADRMPLKICWYWLIKLKARFLSGDHEEALAAADHARTLLWTISIRIESLEYFYYTALTVAALYENATADQQDRWRELLRAHSEQLREWAGNYAPTFADKHALVAAEIARLEGRDADAMRLYEQAIRSAREHGFVQNEGVAHEVAARFYAARGVETVAHACLRNARNCYDRWGALGKVRQLDERYPHLHEERPPASTTSAIGTPVAQLDVQTVVKASQALSSEIVLGKLIETLMRIAVEHAGAERGLLILVQGDEPQIEAEATIAQGRVEVAVRQAVITPSDLPRSALHYVIRTRERVVLDDASAGSLYSEDEYVRGKRARSVLCLPIVEQTKLVGALYLENNLTPRAFTSDRVAVLEMLASQAAISLENARLYTQLREREGRIRRLVDANIIGIFIWDFDGPILEANDAFLDMVGYEREDLLAGRVRWTDLTPPDWRDRDAEMLRQHRRTGRLPPFEKEYFRKDGSRVPVLIGVATFEEEGSQGVAFVLDLTERKRAEKALEEREARIRRLVESNIIGVHFWDAGGGVIGANDEYLRIVGYSRQDLLTGNVNWAGMTPPEYRAADAHALEQVLQSGTFQPYEKEYVRKDGRRIPVLLAGAAFEGSSEEGVAFMLDLTERKLAEAERARLGERLRQAEKMEAVGRFAGGIAHDFNNILSGILAYGEMLLEDATASSPRQRYAQNVLTAATRGRELVEQILTYSRSQPEKRDVVDVCRVVTEALELIRGSLPANILLAACIPALPLAVIGDATQLHQVVMNLCSNSVQAMSGGGTLRVGLEAADLVEERALSQRTLEAGCYVRLTVEDCGSGMDEATLSRIFEPFFTTKEIGRGTGLGLSLVDAIVAGLAGAIDVRSAVAQGTTFAIWLPRAEGGPAATGVRMPEGYAKI